MNISSFYIDRPIFASVISIIVVVAGLVALPLLPISEYPEIVPPTVVVTGQYPGASPKTIAETVITPLEQQINGVENAIYMNSSATPDGAFTITVTFRELDFFGRVRREVEAARAQEQSAVAQYAASQTYAYGPTISWAALDLGRVRSRIGIANAQADAALASYQSTVLLALEETEGALINYGLAQSRRETLEQAAAASSKAASLARQRFEGGLTDFLNVLDAERDVLSAQDSLAQSRMQTATSLIAVYKALGGGWTPER